jgi:hypothetical protein
MGANVSRRLVRRTDDKTAAEHVDPVVDVSGQCGLEVAHKTTLEKTAVAAFQSDLVVVNDDAVRHRSPDRFGGRVATQGSSPHVHQPTGTRALH